MEPLEIIQKYYDPSSVAYDILVTHSEMVTQKALWLAEAVKPLRPDMQLIREAAMLHDIGIFLTHSPGIDCFGEQPYIVHGILGRELLKKEGFPVHGLVCERHIGLGISRTDIALQGLPLPDRDMQPQSLEEKIICFADKFFSKKKGHLREEKTIERIRKRVRKNSVEKLALLEEWIAFFKI